MSPAPGQIPPGTDEAPTDKQAAGVEHELNAWLSWAQQAAAAGGTFAELLRTELRLAIRSAGQLFLLGLLVLPLLLLAWLGTCVALGWLAYSLSGSVLLGVLAFTAVQLLVLALLGYQLKTLSGRLRLPATRQQIDVLMQGARQDEHTPTDR